MAAGASAAPSSGWSTPTAGKHRPTTPSPSSCTARRKRPARESRMEGMSSHTDMGLLVNAGIPTVNFGPGAPSVAHQPDEHVSERDLHRPPSPSR